MSGQPIAPVKGTRDVYGKEAVAMDYIENVLGAVAELYDFKKITPPVLEYTEVFARGAGESSDVVRKEMYTFLDKGNRSVTMRPEFTAGIARSVVSNKLYATEDLPLKFFYAGPAFRYERPQLGRYRQFNQFGVECIGADSAYVDAETLMMAVQSLSMLGFENVKIKINTIGDAESRANYREALVKYFEKHLDEMCEDCHERIKLNPLRILDCKVPHDQELAKGAPKIGDYLSEASKKRFELTLSLLDEMGVAYETDDSLVRGLDYYSEMVFEIHIMGPSGLDYGAICGGGHYGGLIQDLGGPDLPGVGYAMGVERVYSLATELGLLDELEYGVDLYVMPIGENCLKEAFHLATSCRILGYSTETPHQAMKLGQMFKKAEKRNAKFAIIFGEDEIAKGLVQLKNLATKEQKEVSLENFEAELDEAFRPYMEQEEHHCHCHEDGCECHCGEEE